MPVQVTVGTETFNIPLQGENPDWGEEVTDWIQEVSTTLADIISPFDIRLTTGTVANNVSSATNINGFAFSTTFVRSFRADYFIERDTDSITQIAESGIIYGHYNDDSASWSITQETTGDAGITFSITPSGQIQYESTNLSGSSYSGTIKFRAKVIPA